MNSWKDGSCSHNTSLKTSLLINCVLLWFAIEQCLAELVSFNLKILHEVVYRTRFFPSDFLTVRKSNTGCWQIFELSKDKCMNCKKKQKLLLSYLLYPKFTIHKYLPLVRFRYSDATVMEGNFRIILMYQMLFYT